ncbi:hypothetical protein PR048_007912 [Dryococelus australis]|uniref:Uncharacterized protein n=1 Tax=Dryococelus australis TaxID=614101 RepID=A0ABQ9HVK7_9NEOP|nr:hypothetical protein PR048_007912 [Dryococelus australis]
MRKSRSDTSPPPRGIRTRDLFIASVPDAYCNAADSRTAHPKGGDAAAKRARRIDAASECHLGTPSGLHRQGWSRRQPVKAIRRGDLVTAIATSSVCSLRLRRGQASGSRGKASRTSVPGTPESRGHTVNRSRRPDPTNACPEADHATSPTPSKATT